MKNVLCKYGVNRLIIKSNAKIVLENKEWLTKELVNAVANNSDYVTLGVTDMPVVEIKARKDTEILEELTNFVRLFANF
jgi:hypothetical protein